MGSLLFIVSSRAVALWLECNMSDPVKNCPRRHLNYKRMNYTLTVDAGHAGALLFPLLHKN